MLNEDKIKLMSGIALFEKREGRHIFPINRYFKSDYIGSHMTRSFISYTLCFIMGMAIWLAYNIEEFFNSLNTDSIIHMGYRVGILFLIGLIIYELITFRVYYVRYERARLGIKLYRKKLGHLMKRYEQHQNSSGNLAKEGRRDDRASRI